VTADLDPMKAVLVFQTIRQLCVKDIDSPRSKRCEGESVSLTSVRVHDPRDGKPRFKKVFLGY